MIWFDFEAVSFSFKDSISSDRSNIEVTFILAGAVALVVLVAGIFLIRYVVKKRKRGSSADDVTVRWRRGSRANSYGRLSANKTVNFPAITIQILSYYHIFNRKFGFIS